MINRGQRCIISCCEWCCDATQKDGGTCGHKTVKGFSDVDRAAIVDHMKNKSCYDRDGNGNIGDKIIEGFQIGCAEGDHAKRSQEGGKQIVGKKQDEGNDLRVDDHRYQKDFPVAAESCQCNQKRDEKEGGGCEEASDGLYHKFSPNRSDVIYCGENTMISLYYAAELLSRDLWPLRLA